MDKHEELDLHWILSVIRRHAGLIISFVVTTALIVLIVTILVPPVYEANTTLFINPNKDAKTSDYSVLVAGERLTLTYSQILKVRPVLDAAISQLGLKETPNSLAKKITAEPIKDTQLIRITTKYSSPEQAMRLANTIAEVFTSYIRDIDTEQYSGSLATIQDKMQTLSASIDGTQSKVDALNESVVEKEAEGAHLEGLQSDYRNQYRSLLQDYQNLQITTARSQGSVNIVDQARVPANQDYPPYTATLTLILESEQLAPTYSQMLVGSEVMQATITKLSLTETPESLVRRIRVEPVRNTQLIMLNVTDTDKDRAELLANTIAEAFIAQVQEINSGPYAGSLTEMQGRLDKLSLLIDDTGAEIKALNTGKIQVQTELSNIEKLLTENRSDYRALSQEYEQLRLSASDAANTVVIAEPARLPGRPTSHRTQYVILGMVVGLMLGTGLAFLLERLGGKIRTEQDVKTALGLNIQGIIGQLANSEGDLVCITQPNSPNAEAFRMLGTNIRLITRKNSIRTLLVTSPAPTEGKSIVATNLAVALASNGLHVIVVDADLRIPRLHHVFGIDQDVGFTDSLLSEDNDYCLKFTQIDGLRVLTSGRQVPNPVEILSSPKLTHLLDKLKQDTDLVIIDSPPVLSVADATILATEVDGVLLVIRAGNTSTRAAQRMVEGLNKVKANLVGVILNCSDISTDIYNGHFRYTGNGGRTAKSVDDDGLRSRETPPQSSGHT